MGRSGVAMSLSEVERVSVMEALAAGRLRQREAAERLGLGVRQVRRLLCAYRSDGPPGLVSRRRGRPSNRRLPEAVRESALALVRERYADFGPTLAAETLAERHALTVSRETLRRWMVDDGLWRAKAARPVRVHQRRERRPRLGELVQVDGSPHDWFEGRAPRATLILFVDDATSRLMAGGFFEAETTDAYLTVMRDYLRRHGRPRAVYSDRHGIFQVNRPGAEHRQTQFGRAMATLGIDSIRAQSAQAKGRVERANATLQDRLVKAMRLDAVSGLEAANAYLPGHLERHNERFAVEPAEPVDEHRPVAVSATALSRILSRQTTHRLSRNLTFRQDGVEYQLTHCRGQGRRLRNKTVVLCRHTDGRATVLVDDRPHRFRRFTEGRRAPALADDKTLNARVDQTRRQPRAPVRPASNHPWRQAAAVAAERAAAG